MRIAVQTGIARWIGLLVVWIVISDASLPDLPAGAVAAGLASYASFRVLPPGMLRIKIGPLLSLDRRLLRQSVVAGFDIARRALDPKLPLRPGLVRYRSKLPAGPAQAFFNTAISMVPGTLPLGPAAGGILLVHCLDTGDPVLEGLANDESLCLRAIGGASNHV